MKNCWDRNKPKRRREDGKSWEDNSNKKIKCDQVNVAEEENQIVVYDLDKRASHKKEEEIVAFSVNEQKVDEELQDVEEEYNFEEFDAYTEKAIDERLIYYEWLADSATTTHVVNRREIFTNYEPLRGVTVTGVGGTKVVVEGRGTVDLVSKCEGRTHALRLQHVLHIPTNKNNLISLGKWDSAGGSYQSNQGILKLITKGGITITVAKRIENNLYKIQVGVREMATKLHTQDKYETFTTTKSFPSWETWHKRFGHVSYSGLQKLWEKNLVYGFNVNTQMPKPDCVTCTEAKQNEEPHNKEINRQTKPGELTHIDVWGRYEIASINGHQYFILFVDDAT